jgi:signal recognition particle subunit SRP54
MGAGLGAGAGQPPAGLPGLPGGGAPPGLPPGFEKFMKK